jgi:hypothetical protein
MGSKGGIEALYAFDERMNAYDGLFSARYLF